MMEVLGAARRRLEASGAEVFAGHIWPHWSDYQKLPGLQREQLDLIVARQYASYISDRMGADQEDNPRWHPFESYIKPPMSGRPPQTGDIYRLDSELWVVLTPQCDMAGGKVTNVLMALCDPGNGKIAPWNEKVAALVAAQQAGEIPQKLRNWFTDLINQNMEGSAHFLPPLDGQPLLVSFKAIQTVTLERLRDAVGDRVASVAPVFLPNLTQRFGAYISRTGQPNIDIAHFAVPAA